MQGRVELVSPKPGENWGTKVTYGYFGEGPFDGQEYVKSLPNLVGGNPFDTIDILDEEWIQKNEDLLAFLREELQRQDEFGEITNDMKNLGVSGSVNMEELANANPREQYMTLFAAGLETIGGVRISNLLHIFTFLFHFDRGVKLTPLSDALRYAQEERETTDRVGKQGLIYRLLPRLGKVASKDPPRSWSGIRTLLEMGYMLKSRHWDFKDPKARERYIEEQEGLGLTTEQTRSLIYAPYISRNVEEDEYTIIRPQAS